MAIELKQFIDTESSTYTYILSDTQSKEALIIDSVKENLERDLSYLSKKNLHLKYILETHVHADHITAASALKLKTKALIGVSASAELKFADIPLQDDDTLKLGDTPIKILHTPGHTNTCASYYIDDMVFTGDSLLINGCGRTDFQSGDAETLFESIHNKLFTLPDDTKVYPGHDYEGRLHSSIKEEKNSNKRLNNKISKDEFIDIMNNLNLPHPKKIKEALPLNLKSGMSFDELWDKDRNLPEISPQDMLKNKDSFILIDVRRDDEWDGELGHIEGSTLITLGEDFSNFLKAADKNANYVFICRSGNRSGKALLEAKKLGFKNMYNMRGGMLLVNENKLAK